MVKPAQRVDVNSFVGGFFSDATALNFPPNATVDEENFELNTDGTRRRRYGIDLEPNYQALEPAVAQAITQGRAYTTYLWRGAGGFVGFDVVVLAVFDLLTLGVSNSTLMFFNASKEIGTTNGTGNYLGKVLVAGPPYAYGVIPISMASVDGRLVVTNGAQTYAVIEMSTTNGPPVNKGNFSILTRDVWGVQEQIQPAYESDPQYRGSGNPEHLYNLWNQSWGIPRKDAAGTMSDPYTMYANALGVAPSNSEQVWPALQFQAVSGGTPFERIYPSMWDDVRGATNVTPKGYFIIDAVKRGTSRNAAAAANKARYPQLGTAPTGLPTDSDPYGPTVCASFAGRAWFGGFRRPTISVSGDTRSPVLVNHVFFSQLVKTQDDLGKCYQDGDPTSRDSSDILDTDGGFVKISGANNIVAMASLESSLVVLAENGVWSISGGSDYGFTASNYKVDKISEFGCISGRSMVTEGGRVFYWGTDGIYVIGKDQFGSLGAQSLIVGRLNKYYTSLSAETKANSIGVYDTYSKTVKWIFYNNGVPFELDYETTLNAFAKMRLSTLSTAVQYIGMFVKTNMPTTTLNTTKASVGYFINYTDLQVGGKAFSLGLMVDKTFTDWKSINGIGEDAAGFLTTGAQTGGDSGIDKQVPYAVVHMKRTESGVDPMTLVPLSQSGCLMRFQWSFANTINSHKWSTPSQVYKYRLPRWSTSPSDDYDNGFEVVTSRNKIRGRGKAFAMNLQTQPQKDCQVLGWNLTVNGNAVT